MPEVSVIIPTHNRPQWLPRAVASALGSGSDVEVVLVDDASIDGTASVCRELQQERVRYIRLDENRGVAGARNVGLQSARGPYIAFLDDDDLRLSGSLDVQIAALEEYSEAGMACGNILVGDQSCELTGESYEPWQKSGDLFWQMIGLNIPCLPISVVVRRECFERVGHFDVDLAGIDDWDMWTRISESYPVAIVNQPVCIYRDPQPESKQGSSNMARHMARAADHQLRLLNLPRAQSGAPAQRRRTRQLLLDNVFDILTRYAVAWAKQGHYSYARANLLMALRLNPRRLTTGRLRSFVKGLGILSSGVVPLADGKSRAIPREQQSTSATAE